MIGHCLAKLYTLIQELDLTAWSERNGYRSLFSVFLQMRYLIMQKDQVFQGHDWKGSNMLMIFLGKPQSLASAFKSFRIDQALLNNFVQTLTIHIILYRSRSNIHRAYVLPEEDCLSPTAVRVLNQQLGNSIKKNHTQLSSALCHSCRPSPTGSYNLYTMTLGITWTLLPTVGCYIIYTPHRGM